MLNRDNVGSSHKKCTKSVGSLVLSPKKHVTTLSGEQKDVARVYCASTKENLNSEFYDLLAMHRSEASEAQDKFSIVSNHTLLPLGNMLTPDSIVN